MDSASLTILTVLLQITALFFVPLWHQKNKQEDLMKVFISGLPLQVGEGELTEVFSDFGPVKSLRIIKDHQTKQSKGFGFVEMVNEEEAKEAIKYMNGQRYYDNIIRVNVAEDKGPRPANNGGGNRKPRF